MATQWLPITIQDLFPAEILVKDGECFVIREAQSFDDIFAKQSVPEHLQ